MNILILNWRDWLHPDAGGAEEDIRQFARYALASGHNVELVCSRPEGFPALEVVDGCRVRRWGGRFSVYPHVLKFLHETGAPSKYDLIVDDVNGVPWFAPLASASNVVAIFHHEIGFDFFRELPFPFSLLGYSIERLFPRLYHDVPFVVRNPGSRSFLISHGVRPDYIRVIPSGLDHEIYKPTKPKTNLPSLLFVGPVKEYKRPDLAIQALAHVIRQFPGATLDVVGALRGDIRSRMIALASKLGVSSQLRLWGRVTESVKVDLISRSWVTLIPSKHEGWGLVAVEAAACGTPVVGFRIPGLSSSVGDRVSGLLVEPFDIKAYCDTTLAVIADSRLRAGLSSGAVEWSDQFSWNRYYAEVMRFIEEYFL